MPRISEETMTGNVHNGTPIDVKAHNAREVSVKKRKSREQDYLGNDLVESNDNAFYRKLRKHKKLKVIQTEKKKSSRSKGEGKSRRRDTGIKDSAPTEREQQANKYGVKQQSQAECGMMRKPVYKKMTDSGNALTFTFILHMITGNQS
uniref:Uncharacterized protein n=1 Tax=Solanum lycopersicum TaxID=4081 RepID=A0A3Q7HNW4_SOLLC